MSAGTVEAAEDALAKANATVDDLHGVEIIGGGVRVPARRPLRLLLLPPLPLFILPYRLSSRPHRHLGLGFDIIQTRDQRGHIPVRATRTTRSS